jgi:hypothetical protein
VELQTAPGGTENAVLCFNHDGQFYSWGSDADIHRVPIENLDLSDCGYEDLIASMLAMVGAGLVHQGSRFGHWPILESTPMSGSKE